VKIYANTTIPSLAISQQGTMAALTKQHWRCCHAHAITTQ